MFGAAQDKLPYIDNKYIQNKVLYSCLVSSEQVYEYVNKSCTVIKELESVVRVERKGAIEKLDLAPLLVVGVDVVVEAILGLVFAKAQAKQKQRDL